MVPKISLLLPGAPLPLGWVCVSDGFLVYLRGRSLLAGFLGWHANSLVVMVYIVKVSPVILLIGRYVATAGAL